MKVTSNFRLVHREGHLTRESTLFMMHLTAAQLLLHRAVAVMHHLRPSELILLLHERQEQLLLISIDFEKYILFRY